MDSITVTERAAQRIGEILRREPVGTMLRVSVEGGGCSGFQYKFDMDRAQGADDLVIQRGAATVLIDQTSVGYLAGSEIDFVDDLIGASFRINNPQATASCPPGAPLPLTWDAGRISGANSNPNSALAPPPWRTWRRERFPA